MRTYLFLLLLISGAISSQAQNDSTTNESEDDDAVAFAVIEEVPIYPGCRGKDNAVLKDCMSRKIQEFVSREFNIKKMYKLGLKEGRQRISVQFKVNTKGRVVDVRARGPHPELEKEAVRVVKKLPKMKPGKQRGDEISVLYALPILFHLDYGDIPIDNKG